MGNPWMDHVKAVKKANPGKSLKEVLKMAGKTYKKQPKAPGAKKSRKTRKTRKMTKKARKGARKSRKSKRRMKGGKVPPAGSSVDGAEHLTSV